MGEHLARRVKQLSHANPFLMPRKKAESDVFFFGSATWRSANAGGFRCAQWAEIGTWETISLVLWLGAVQMLAASDVHSGSGLDH